ncbi:MAG TPA: rhodanese-like domain-containing protein [Gemmatimonadaceae bacterium]
MHDKGTNPGGEHEADSGPVTPRELAELLRGDTPPFLLDVREPAENAHARIGGETLIPLRTLPTAVEDIPRDRVVVVYCHHGARSARAVDFLRAHGIDARNLTGGIDRWSIEVDPSVPRY